MLNGIINVYKEKGYTSHDVVAKLRGILRQKKIGHAGTLDPDAEGVLLVCLGKATKACGLLTDKDKEYEAVLLLGKTTDTQDVSGKVLAEREVLCSPAEAKAAALSFVGKYMQVPPMYSALKVNGQKLCDLARKGVEVERAPREVTVFSIEVGEISLPRMRMEVHCSKGTYIRTLCHDIGEALGCGGCMESLTRTRVSGFRREDAKTLSEIEARAAEARERRPGKELENGDLGGLILDTDALFGDYPAVYVRPEFGKPLGNGNPLKPEWLEGWRAGHEGTPLRVYDGQTRAFAGIFRYEGERGLVKPVKIFMG